MEALTLQLLSPIVLLLSSLLLDVPGSPAPGSSAPSSSVQQWVNQFSTSSTQVLQVVNTTFKSIMGVAWVTLISLGMLLYLTHLHRKMGKEFFFGGIAMAILVQFILPWLATI